MNKKIDNEIIERALKGSLEDKDTIVELLEPLIKSSISKYYYRAHLYDDLMQDGKLEILKCFENFNPSQGVYFLGYVKTMLRYYYLNRNRDKECFSLDETNEEGLCQLELLESDENIEEDYIESETNDELKAAMAVLTEIEKSVIVDFYYNNLSLYEIADKRGIKYRTAVNNKTRAINKLKTYFEEINFKFEW